MKSHTLYKSTINKFVLLIFLIISIEVQSLENNISSEYNNFSVTLNKNLSNKNNLAKRKIFKKKSYEKKLGKKYE